MLTNSIKCKDFFLLYKVYFLSIVDLQCCVNCRYIKFFIMLFPMKHQFIIQNNDEYCILIHVHGIYKDGTDEPIGRAALKR